LATIVFSIPIVAEWNRVLCLMIKISLPVIITNDVSVRKNKVSRELSALSYNDRDEKRKCSFHMLFSLLCSDYFFHSDWSETEQRNNHSIL